MNIVAFIARILLGLIFLVFGANGFLHFIPSPPLTGYIVQFTEVLFLSHYYVLTFGAQVLGGILLLIDRYVFFALVMLAAVLVNILTFHLTMNLTGLPVALFTTLVWILAALPYRAKFAALFAAR